MITSNVLSLDSRRRAGADHRTRTDYRDVDQALEDAMSLAAELVRPGQLVVPIDELEFTATRLQALIAACRATLQQMNSTDERPPS